MAKRPGGEASAPAAKRPSLAMSPLDIGPACGEEDLNMKVLQVQNKKLSERLRERNFARELLKARLEEVEGRVQEQREALSSLPRHMLALRESLALLVPGRAGLEVLERFREESRPEASLEEGFRAAVAVLRHLAVGERGEGGVAEALEPCEVHVGSLQDENQALKSRCEDAESALADARFDMERSVARVMRLEKQLSEAVERLQTTSLQAEDASSTQQATPTPSTNTTTTSSVGERASSEEAVGQQSAELGELRALAEERLKETEVLSQQIVQLRVEVEDAREESRSRLAMTGEQALASTAYLSLQTQFSVVQQENSQLRASLEELKTLLYEARAQHFTQLDELRAEEVKYEGEVREEMAQLEALLAASKRDYELLRIEFERRMASNEQAAPLAKELEVTVGSLQKTISQLKSEVGRYKTRAHKAEARLHEEASRQKATPTAEEAGDSSTTEQPEQQQMQAKVKTLQEEKKILEDKLEGYRLSDQDDREKSSIIASERKARGQVEELRRRLEEVRREYEKRKEHVKEEAARRAKALAEDNKHLQRELVAKRQEAQALVGEMECTAQAFEEVQEQNLRLLQQIKEKDDANFKVISERIKSSSIQKLLMEEKDLLQSQISNLAQEKNRMSEVMVRMEERDRNHEATLVAMEKDLTLKQQAMDTLKKKAVDSSQGVLALQLQVEEGERDREAGREKVRERLEDGERMAQQLRRAQEEVATLKRRLERHKSREWASASDEVLLEEIRTYKAKLNCPCCSTRKKDTVLTKCFHVFCSECIRSRYDSRLRKCPKCGAAFGANDFHKLYLS